MVYKTRYFKNFLFFTVYFLLFSVNIFGQTITHPSSGTSSSTITCGTTYNYYDPGGVGNYGNNQLGTLTLNPSVGGQYVQIDFTTGPFDIEPNGGGCFDWIEIYDGPNTSSPLIGTYCNSTIPTTITSSTGSLTIVFDSDGLTIGTGWDADVSCSVAPGPPPPLIHPSSGSSSSTITCGATSTYLDPGGTGNYSNNQLGTMTFNPSIGGLYVQIDFTAGAFDVEACGGASCTCDWIQVYDGVNAGTPLIGRYCNGNIPGTIISSTGSLTIVFDSDGGAIGSGWVADVSCSPTPGPPPPFVHPSSGTSSTTITCGTTYDYYDPGGVAGNYSNNQTGILTFNPSIVGQMIQIDFTTGPFDIEGCGGASCTCDWIQIYDGINTGAPLIGKYCNGNIPAVITSSTGSLTIEFFRDALTTGTGWDAEITCFSPCATSAGTSSASPNTFCPAAGNTTLTLAGEDPAATIQWQVSTNGGITWSNIAGATTDPWAQAVAVNSMYQALVTNGCTSTSTSISVSVGCPDIIQPTTGTTSTTIQCGGSYNYYDSGGSGSNYSSNENGLITICPSTAGQYVSLTVVSFNIENNFDYLYVFDGNDGSADIIGIYTGSIAAGATITASSANTSGCLSFRFTSDGGTNNSGWNLTVNCTGTPAAPYPTSVEDCTGGVVVCGNGALNGGTTGYGYQELPSEWNSCLNFGGNGEIQSNWYIFSPSTNGTIGFLISPSPAADYDWTLWGPYNSLQCPAFTNDLPLRCSAASLATSGPGGETGLAAPAVDIVEGSGGNGYLQPLTVIAGEIYILMLDNWDGNSNPFTLSWQLSNGATLDCSPPLPVKLLSFETKCEGNKTKLQWTTESEINNDYFVIEKSGPDFIFQEIGKISGAGNSNIQNNYSFIDTEINNETAYYRLMQVDFDGSVEYHRIVASNCHDYSFDVVKTNLTNNNLDLLITSSTNEHLTISLYNSTGKLITKVAKEINSGNNTISLNNFNISRGIYLISIQGEYNNYSQKILSK